MKESFHRYFQVGVIQNMSHPVSRRAFLDSVKQFASDEYFDALEITHIASDDERAQARRMLEASHMRVLFAAQPMLLGAKLNPNALDEEERLAAEKTLLEAVDEARGMHAETVAFLAGKWASETKEQAYRQLIRTTQNVCAYAARFGMHVELEVFDYDMDKASLIGPAPLAAKFAADMRSLVSNFGLLVDLSHFPTTYETSRFVVRTLRPYITHFHIGNAVVQLGCEAYGDLHPRFGFPNSANDVAQLLDFLQVLKTEGFFCAEQPYVLSFEVKPWNEEDCEIVLANTKRVLNRAWALLDD